MCESKYWATLGWVGGEQRRASYGELVQGKVAVPLSSLSPSSLPNLRDFLLPERTGRGCLMGWKGFKSSQLWEGYRSASGCR